MTKTNLANREQLEETCVADKIFLLPSKFQMFKPKSKQAKSSYCPFCKNIKPCSYINNLVYLFCPDLVCLIENNFLVWHQCKVLVAVFNHKHIIVIYL